MGQTNDEIRWELENNREPLENLSPCLVPINETLRKPSGEVWYFTLGFDHGEHGGKGFVEILGTYRDARAEMCRRYGTGWSFQYDWESFKEQPKKYRLYRVAKYLARKSAEDTGTTGG